MGKNVIPGSRSVGRVEAEIEGPQGVRGEAPVRKVSWEGWGAEEMKGGCIGETGIPRPRPRPALLQV